MICTAADTGLFIPIKSSSLPVFTNSTIVNKYFVALAAKFSVSFCCCLN